jgi:hypothetical protein
VQQAESRDLGATWTKPALGLVPWGASINATPSTANNIIGADRNLSSSDYMGWIGRNEDPNDADDPSRRFVATITVKPSWFKTIPAGCTPFGTALHHTALSYAPHAIL